MKPLLSALIFLTLTSSPFVAFSQWTLNGSFLFPTNYSTTKVGIGTNTPDHLLQIGNGSVPVSLSLRGPDGTTNTGVIAFEDEQGVNGHWFRFYHNALDNRLTLSSYERAQIMSFKRATGNVGIGVAEPLAALHLKKMDFMISDEATDLINLRIDATSCGAGIRFTRWMEDVNNQIFQNAFIGQFENSENYSFGIATGSSTTGDQNALNMALTVLLNGNVGIGTITPDAKLTVKGDIHTREVNIDLEGVLAPDYVFEKDYNLLPLAEVEAYIHENKHLPDVPSASEMDTNGLNVKQMNLLLLKKVEELTLHLIEQEKKLIKQQDEIQELKRSLKK